MKLFVLLVLPWLISAQKDDDQPSKRDKYVFTQAWVWQYRNDWIKPGEEGNKGEFTVYYDTVTKAWLFDVEAFGETGHGFDFVLGNYDGQYTFGFRNEKGKKRKTVRNMPEIAASRTQNLVIKEEFENNHQSTGNTRIFGKNVFGWQQIEGEEYQFQHLNSSEKTIRYVADSDIDFQAVVYFNFLEGEVKIPFHFPTDVPIGKVLLENATTYEDGKQIILRLKEITYTEYRIDLSKYR